MVRPERKKKPLFKLPGRGAGRVMLAKKKATSAKVGMALPAPKTSFFSKFKKKKLSPKGNRPLPAGKILKPKRPLWRRILLGFGIFFALLILGGALAFGYYAPQLPNPRKITERTVDQSTQIYDRNGTKLYDFHGDENRTITTYAKISPFITKAVVATEDADFYNHHGFSPKGILRSVLARVVPGFNRAEGGGSTLTQQYIKNALLTDDHSLDRKLRELILAIEIELNYPKNDILTGYLNEISYGGNIYGVETASETFFNKHASDVTLSEAAVLAAIPQAPSYYSPYGSNLDDLFDRKNYVLSRMVTTGAITQAEADEAKKATPNKESPAFSASSNLTAPHFVFYVRQKLIEQLGGDPVDAEKRLDTEGFTVITSLDLPTQRMAEKILADMGPGTIAKYNGTNASLTAIDPKTGEVLAMVGSIDYEKSKSGNNNFANAPLQPGSSIKPLVYASAFSPTAQTKMNPGSTTFDVQTDFGGGYKPNDYDGKFRGPISNRSALAGSLNIPTLKNLALGGIDNFLSIARGLGITTFTGTANDYGLSIGLGAGEVRQVELAGAYTAVANGGMRSEVRPILKITKGTQTIKDFAANQPSKALEPEVAYQVTSIMSDNNARAYVFGQRNFLTLPDRPVAAKTGTTENNRDAWTVGFTPQIITAVWVGNNDNNKVMTKGADGSVVAAPIWNKFMTEYHKGKAVQQFMSPPPSMKQITLDKWSGKLATDVTPEGDRVTEWLAPWQIPKDTDSSHYKVKVVRSTGKLATDLTPADQIDEQTFLKVTGERPSDPNWENPVQAWLAASNLIKQPPTEKDTAFVAENAPKVSITYPAENGYVQGNFTLKADISGAREIKTTKVNINGVAVTGKEDAPWEYGIGIDRLNPGANVIELIAINVDGLQTAVKRTIYYETGVSGNSGVSNLAANNGNKTTNVPIKVIWTNPNEASASQAFVYLSTTADPTDAGSRVASVSIAPKTASSIDIPVSGLSVGTYYVTVRIADSSGKEGASAAKVAVKVE